ncbi:MAG: hypothetical protein WAV47_14445 [Blastocatellia bacterium]
MKEPRPLFGRKPLQAGMLAGWAIGLLAATIPVGSSAPPVTSHLQSGFCPPLPTSITSQLANPPLDFCGIDSQPSMDLYSWLTFVAMNWPANVSACGPDTTKSILSGQGPVVWETYLEDSEVFVAPGLMPVQWPCPSTGNTTERLSLLPAAVQAKAKQYPNVTKFLHFVSKSDPVKLPAIEEAVGGPLTDQNGRFVRYEIRMNQDEYNYIKRSSLWSQAGQAAFQGPVNFPSSEYKTGDIYHGVFGSMEIKAAWKVLNALEKASKRFYTREAIIYNTEDPQSVDPTPVTVGLVGLHIIHKTKAQPQWLWSTFEHEDNAPTAGRAVMGKYSFNNPACPFAKCPPNSQTVFPPYTELNKQGQPVAKPVQVLRMTPLESGAAQLNPVFKKLLGSSVWSHYFLVGTQWRGEIPTPQPQPLANTVLETYIQSFSSCIGCHSGATLAACSNGKTPASADFSFMLSEAK